MALKFDRYNVTLTFQRDVLATNPADPAVMDTHILERQRKLIMEQSPINKEINKYLNAPQITEARGHLEIETLADKLEELMGEPLSPSQRALVAAGKLEELRETFKDFNFKGTTVFFWNKELKRPMIGDHMIYGFLKDAAVFWGRRDGVTKKSGAVLSMDAKGKVTGTIGHTQSVINQDVKCATQFITFDQELPKGPDGGPVFNQRSLRAQTAQGPRVTLAKSEYMPAGSTFSFQLKLPLGSQMSEESLCMLFDAGESIGFGQWRGAAHGIFEYKLERVEA